MKHWFGLLPLFLCLSAFAADEVESPNPPPPPPRPQWVAHILRETPAEKKIKGLSIVLDELPVVLVPKAEKLRPLAEIHLVYDRPGWVLLAQEKPLMEVSQKAVELKVPLYLNSRVNQFSMEAKGPNGDSEKETIYIVSPLAKEFAVLNSWDRVLISLGLTNLSYMQTGYGTYTSSTALFGLQYASPPETNWGFYSSLDITAVSFAESPIKAGAEIIEGKVDAAYALTPSNQKSSWRHQLLGGASFLTMYANTAKFGFNNLIAPEFGMRSRYISNAKDAYIIDWRYVPISTPSAAHRGGINLSFAYSHILPSFHRIEPSLSYSSYYFQPETEKTIHVDLIVLRVGYSL